MKTHGFPLRPAIKPLEKTEGGGKGRLTNLGKSSGISRLNGHKNLGFHAPGTS